MSFDREDHESPYCEKCGQLQDEAPALRDALAKCHKLIPFLDKQIATLEEVNMGLLTTQARARECRHGRSIGSSCSVCDDATDLHERIEELESALRAVHAAELAEAIDLDRPTWQIVTAALGMKKKEEDNG